MHHPYASPPTCTPTETVSSDVYTHTFFFFFWGGGGGGGREGVAKYAVVRNEILKCAYNLIILEILSLEYVAMPL